MNVQQKNPVLSVQGTPHIHCPAYKAPSTLWAGLLTAAARTISPLGCTLALQSQKWSLPMLNQSVPRHFRPSTVSIPERINILLIFTTKDRSLAYVEQVLFWYGFRFLVFVFMFPETKAMKSLKAHNIFIFFPLCENNFQKSIYIF